MTFEVDCDIKTPTEWTGNERTRGVRSMCITHTHFEPYTCNSPMAKGIFTHVYCCSRL